MLDEDQTADINANFVTKFTIEESNEGLYDRIKKAAKTVVPNFAESAVTDETADGLFSMEDDYGMSYYYRGAVENNYVKFGKNSDGQDMYWRIIRFNGDGSVRMQYDGRAPHSETSFSYTRENAITNQPWNSVYTDNKYMGYMYGNSSDTKENAQSNDNPSEIKTALEDWYENNIEKTGYGVYIADEIFCNDRSILGATASGWPGDTGLGTLNNETAYGAYARLEHFNTREFIPTPQFTCPKDNDKFTKSAENGGNGKLNKPVGMITADEIVAAGSGKFRTANTNYYLHKDIWYWSFSPCHYYDGAAYMFNVDNGSLANDHVNVTTNGGGVSPVINIKAEYVNHLKGTGLITDPFRF